MLNILIPLSGKNTFKVNKQNAFPRILSEIEGKLLLERAAKPFINLQMDKRITVAVPQKEAEKYQLNKVVSLLGDDIYTCAINGDTQGAACSALLAIESLELDSPLIISSFEQVLEFDLSEYIEHFSDENIDAGVLTFEAIHPKWSYVKTDYQGYVTQAAEKMPISKQAIAGLYYFKTARMFIEAAKSMIRKDVKTNDSFFISPTLNEIILKEGRVKAIEVDKSKYFHISDEHALEAFELRVSEENENVKNTLLEKTKNYIYSFNEKDISSVGRILSEEFELLDPSVSVSGKANALEYINGIFSNVRKLSFLASDIYIPNETTSIIEFELYIDDKKLIGTDVIKWNEEKLMVGMKAYLFEIDNG